MPGAVCLVLGALLQAQPPRMPSLPLTQLDEQQPASDLDNRTFSLTFAQPVQLRDLLLLLVRGTALSIVPDPALSGTFIGELKNVTVRQALTLILQPHGFDFGVDGTVIRVFKRETDTRMFDVNYIATIRSGTTTIAGDNGASSRASVATETHTDLFADVATGVRALLSDKGTVTVDRKAGLLQVTDFAERLDRVAVYLETVNDRVHRQVQVDARVIEVELNDEKAQGINWVDAMGQPKPTTGGMRVTDVARLLSQLAMQGAVTTLASPSLLTVNNEPAIVRSDTLTVSVTPQIGTDGALMLDVTPIMKGASAREADMLMRVADGETIVLAGFTRDRDVKEKKNLGLSGGWFGRGTVVVHKKLELVLLLTPHVVVGASAQ